MTLLYGGGSAAGQSDAADPFRIPSIRGQLRFWWRATRGAACATLDDLRRKEAEIWGDTQERSRIVLRILRSQRGVERKALTQRERWDYEEPRYALFPAQENRKNIGTLYEGGSFDLEVALEARTPEQAQQLQVEANAALWAWLTFGGIGARTRRGCGAIDCPTYAGTWLREATNGSGRRSWPVLGGGRVIVGSQELPWKSCWMECIRVLKEYRQDRYRPQGRSVWPEADEIRRIRGVHSSRHAPANTERGFPRVSRRV